MITYARSSGSDRAAEIRRIVEAGRRAGLVRRPGDPVEIAKNGAPVAAEAGLRSQ